MDEYGVEKLKNLLRNMVGVYLIVIGFHFIAFFIVWDASVIETLLANFWFWIRLSIFGGCLIAFLDG